MTTASDSANVGALSPAVQRLQAQSTGATSGRSVKDVANDPPKRHSRQRCKLRIRQTMRHPLASLLLHTLAISLGAAGRSYAQPSAAAPIDYPLGGESFQLFAGVRSKGHLFFVGKTLQLWDGKAGAAPCPAFGYAVSSGKAMPLRLPVECKGATGVDISLTSRGARALVLFAEQNATGDYRRLALVSFDTKARVKIEALSGELLMSDAFPRRATSAEGSSDAVAIASIDEPTAKGSPWAHFIKAGQRLEAVRHAVPDFDGMYFGAANVDREIVGIGRLLSDPLDSCSLVVFVGSTGATIGHQRLPGDRCGGLSVLPSPHGSWIVAESFGADRIMASVAKSAPSNRLELVDTLSLIATGASALSFQRGLLVAGFRSVSNDGSLISVTYLGEGRTRCETSVQGPKLPTSVILVDGRVPTLAWFDVRDAGDAVTGVIRVQRVSVLGASVRDRSHTVLKSEGAAERIPAKCRGCVGAGQDVPDKHRRCAQDADLPPT